MNRTRAIRLEAHGGPEELKHATFDLPPPGPGELRIRQGAAGVNYHDVYVRTGLYQTLALPGVPGLDAAGTVEAVGDGVTGFAPGDRVGYVTSAYGGYAAARNLPAALAVHLPGSLSDVQAAASLLKAWTACVLLTRVRTVVPGETILVQAAAGGMGQLLCRWASHLGATVIGTAGSPEKAQVARDCGAAHVILYRDEDVAARVHDLTAGAGVAAVYDSVGADTFDGSIAALAMLGHMVCFGQSSGPVAPFTPALLSSRSLTLSRPLLFHYIRTPEQLRAIADETFAAFAAGAIRPIDPVTFPLDQAAEAHRLLEDRKSPGGVVLVP